MIYCIVPPEIWPALQDPLERFYREDPSVEVMVERRAGERRGTGGRRSANGRHAPPGGERRAVRNREGRRVGERRALTMPVSAPLLPRRARRHTRELDFVERIEPPPVYLEDQEAARLVCRAQMGDREAFNELYGRYFKRVSGYLRAALCDEHEAEDIAQDAFIRVLAKLPSYEIRPGKPFRAYLFLIARRQAIKHMAKHGRVRLEAPERISDLRDEIAEDADLRSVDWLSDGSLQPEFQRLSAAQRRVLMLRYLVGLTTSEVSEVVGGKPESIRRMQNRALRSLQTRLTAVGHHRPRQLQQQPMVVLRQPANVLRARRFALASPRCF